jgi:group I intron endonuclease
MTRTGIYEIRNAANGKRYIGSSQNVNNRLANHFSALRHDHHDNQHLQRAFNKHGESNFKARVLQECSIDQLLIIEQQYLDQKPEYNIAPFAGAGMRGMKQTESARKAMSEKLKGRVLTEDHKRRISEAHQGMSYGPLSEEHKKKIGEGNRGRKHRPESIAKMCKVQSGKTISPEQRRKIAESKSKPVVRICPKTGHQKYYKSISATKDDGFNISNVARVCSGERKQHKSYLWSYAIKEVTYC